MHNFQPRIYMGVGRDAQFPTENIYGGRGVLYVEFNTMHAI